MQRSLIHSINSVRLLGIEKCVTFPTFQKLNLVEWQKRAQRREVKGAFHPPPGVILAFEEVNLLCLGEQTRIS